MPLAVRKGAVDSDARRAAAKVVAGFMWEQTQCVESVRQAALSSDVLNPVLPTVVHLQLSLPKEKGAVLQPQRHEVTVGPQWTAASPEKQAVVGCALETHEQICPGTRYPGNDQSHVVMITFLRGRHVD